MSALRFKLLVFAARRAIAAGLPPRTCPGNMEVSGYAFVCRTCGGDDWHHDEADFDLVHPFGGREAHDPGDEDPATVWM